jgi:hypothetical protein
VDHIQKTAGTKAWWATHASAAEYVRRTSNLGEPRPRPLP